MLAHKYNVFLGLVPIGLVFLLEVLDKMSLSEGFEDDFIFAPVHIFSQALLEKLDCMGWPRRLGRFAKVAARE